MNEHVLHVIRMINLLGTAFAIGATVWFFFIQSPLLLKVMGRDKFVPIQMRLTKSLFTALAVALVITLVATVMSAETLLSCVVATAVLAQISGMLNRFVILPRAFVAAGQRRVETYGQGGATAEGVTEFASEGLGGGTKLLHRSIVLLVLVMILALMAHAMHSFII